MKNKTFAESIACAVQGLLYAVKSEKNYKYYFFIDFIFLLLDIYIRVSPVIWLGYIITSCSVYAMECVNTSIEHLCNFLSNEYRPEFKLIKDMAAGAVLVCGIGFFAVQLTAIILFRCRL